ncbi:bifunctional protein-disulfide isomerase/oxidoreductase DsbC [Vibrio sp.]|nr:bifunctional protein-disulfide isomerase/oxidoreductase DsbC [Vibrio sp.]
MRLLRQILTITLSIFAVSFASQAADFNKQELTKKFQKLGVTVNEIKPSDIDGLLEVQTSGGVIFSTPKGDYFIAGTLYQFNSDGTYDDVIAKRQAPLNADKINQFADDMIVYKAKDEKYIVTIFTDITCGYCSRLHGQMQQYNDLGITVRYLAFPRQGATGQVADQMATIWCADDKEAAYNTVESDRKLPAKNANFSSCQKKVAEQHNLGRELGVAGTPAIFLPNGMMIGGYLPPEQLLKRLQDM